MKTIQVSQVGLEEHILFHSHDIAIFKSFKDFASFTQEDFLLDGFVMVLILQGQAIFTVEGRHYELHEGQLFVSVPRNVVKVMQSVDIEVAGIFASSEFVKSISQETPFDLTPLLIERSLRFASISEQEQALFTSYLHTTARLLAVTNNPVANRGFISLFQSFAYVLRGFVSSEAEHAVPPPDAMRCSAEIIVKRFLDMLDGNHGGFLKVNDYAEQLCITPKYLSAVCKSVTGQTAGQLISDSILRAAKMLLRNPRLSVKEISIQLGFPNSSHFGTYIRRATGHSPQALRSSLL